MAARREEGFYRRLEVFSTADEWKALYPPVKKRQTRPTEPVYEVECILGERKRKGESEFLVKWRGWGSQCNTWEPQENFLNPAIIRNFESPCLSAGEVEGYCEMLLNIFEAGLCQNLSSKFTVDFPVRAFNYFFRGKGQQLLRGTWALYKEDFCLCRFPAGWDRAWVNARKTERELIFPILLHPFLSRSPQLYNADGSKRQRRWTQRLTISFRKHTV